MLYVSTDFVFDGRKRAPYRPDDRPAPLSAYGRSKRAGEEAVARSGAAFLTVRTGWLYGAGGHNFVRAVLSRAAEGAPLRVVSDQRGRPTWARQAADVMLALVDRGARGVWHVCDGGEATWYELACEALDIAGQEAEVEPIDSDDWPAAAPRPRYSVLDLTATERLLGRAMTPWRESLRRYLERT